MERIAKECIVRMSEAVDGLMKKGATPAQLMIALTEATVRAALYENDPLEVAAHLDSVVTILSIVARNNRERTVGSGKLN